GQILRARALSATAPATRNCSIFPNGKPPIRGLSFFAQSAPGLPSQNAHSWPGIGCDKTDVHARNLFNRECVTGIVATADVPERSTRKLQIQHGIKFDIGMKSGGVE